ncbi:rRNA biogenesis protein rrp36 [Didymosphaeria variabile]|uniref:rRNA biogenesis protein RRP36 n=1 Tax=Didymosphaeria variabile TaxID=1932322 RepID=A0A9W8XET9_9PLEO|nr:rRNA biogenesis protein rrp36 [Didymosphaeria variabile]KAJ4347904.1 rRNA biogenesis protein rrp36 [Didymosphaeria variabile]
MPLSSKLEKKLRAAEESSDDEEYYEVTDRSSSPSIIETGEGGELLDSEEEDEGDEDDLEDEEMSDNAEEVAKAQMSKVSFGALAKAQDAISKQHSVDRKRKRGDESSKSQDDKLQALRERLAEIKAAKLAQGGTSQPKSKARKTQQKQHTRDDDGEEDDSDDSGSDSDTAPRARSSKHAPAVQTSKKAVSRKRQVVDAKKPKFRDPRFDIGPQPDDNTLHKRYAFLNDYKISEMNELRDAIKKTKNEADKEKLKKKLTSMESQQKAQRNKDQQQDVLREHKKKERELVKQGKTPFFLKKSEQKKLALVDRFQNMKSKDRDRAIERRRKKATAKERKNMPAERRGV